MNTQINNSSETPFERENRAVLVWIRTNSNSGNSFAASLLQQFERKGSLSEKQVAAVMRNLDKAPKAQPAASEQLAAVVAAFNAACASGLKRPVMRLRGATVSRAPDTGVNAGYLYVKSPEGDYCGKISSTGQFFPTRDCDAEVAAAVAKLNSETLLDEVQQYGFETGECGCCGRTLTNPDSIAAGIGPICASRWF